MMQTMQSDFAAESKETLCLTPSGEIIGLFDGGAHAWLGVPYAEPPTGAFRWRAPRPNRSWQGTFVARAPGPRASQPAHFGSETNGVLETTHGEDCLYLNIWAPPTQSALPRPVLVWIHGGGNFLGQGHTYSGSRLAVSQDVVVVTLNYRLGIFGWFRHPVLVGENASAEDRSGNFGMLDQIEALRWVARHIGAFGGDPNNVTLFGESAGATNVLALLVSPLSAGLFHRAIVQSAVVGTTTIAAAENFADDPTPGHMVSAREVILHLLLAEGAASDRTEAKVYLDRIQAADLASYLRSKTYQEFAAACEDIHSRTGHRAGPSLIEDGYVIPKGGILQALETGRYNRVPTILGATQDELTVILPVAGGVPAFLEPKPGEFHFTIKDRIRYDLAMKHANALYGARGVYEPAALMAKHQRGEIFTYRFDWAHLAPAPWLDGVSLGAPHGVDVAFVFGTRKLGPEFIQLALMEPEHPSFGEVSSAVMSYWAAFAKLGAPGTGRQGTLPLWPAFDPDQSEPQTLIIDSNACGGIRTLFVDADTETVLYRLATDTTLGSLVQHLAFLKDLEAIAYGPIPSDWPKLRRMAQEHWRKITSRAPDP